MLGEDYLNYQEEEEFLDLVQKCESAYHEGSLESLVFTEEEFEYLMNHFMDSMDDEILYTLASMGYKQHPYSFDLTIRYIDVLIVNKELDKAMEILQNRLPVDSVSSDILLLTARIYIMKGEEVIGDEFLEKAIILDPEESVNAMMSIAQDLMDSGMFIDASYYLERCEQLDLQRESPQNRPDLINDLAFCYERQNRLDKSLDYYNKYLDIDPFNDNVWFNIGTIYARQQKIAKATEAFDYALALNRYNSSVLYNKAILLVNSGKLDESIDTFEEFLKLEPDNFYAFIGIADAYLAKDRLDESERFFKLALSHDSENNDANTGLAYISMIRHDVYNSLYYLRKIMGNESTDFGFVSYEISSSFKRTKNPEFLLYYLIALYHARESETFYIYLEILMNSDEVWVAKLFEFIPALKKDKSFHGKLSKIKKKNS